jgi:V/A-type H+-transporting ATPase subunit K
MEYDLKTLSAALAIGLSAFATAYAQGRIGSAAVGAIVEKKELAGIMIILVAIPETMVILGFVIAALLIYK